MTVLTDARARGFLGKGPVEAHIAHARGFLRHWRPRRSGLSLDLGSGGGVPGLVLAHDRPGSRWVLLDASVAKTAFLAGACTVLGMEDRVEVVTARAEVAGRDGAHRGRYASVVARAFAAPAVVAECAAPLLGLGGLLLVSEPPEQRLRWPAVELNRLGLIVEPLDATPPQIAVLHQERLCPDRFPRRVGIPAKRPLWW